MDQSLLFCPILAVIANDGIAYICSLLAVSQLLQSTTLAIDFAMNIGKKVL